MQAGKYRFVGASCLIGDTEYNRLGQYAEFDAQLAKDVILAGGKFLPEADFDALFSQEECNKYPHMNGWPEAPQDLQTKRKQALQAIDVLLSQFEHSQD